MSEHNLPRKRIASEQDVETFHQSIAYDRITGFIQYLCQAVSGRDCVAQSTKEPVIESILTLIHTCESWLEQCPPHSGPRRFGNAAFRDWHELLNANALKLVTELLVKGQQPIAGELTPYFLGAFGSPERLDYGTGHELAFIAFLCGLLQVDLISKDSLDLVRSVALDIYPAYLRLIQQLITKYTLEPAGSHGVWGLDDHFAVPYLLGAAQLSEHENEVYPTPAAVLNKKDVQALRTSNLYFNAISFINDVKTGPFWEHSPMLYDISGVNNWLKISRGMIKMYKVEVLGKFPVVQHFLFGEHLFPFASISSAVAQDDTPEQNVYQSALLDLKDVQDRTKLLVVSEYAMDRAAERAELDADTPLPEDHANRRRENRHHIETGRGESGDISTDLHQPSSKKSSEMPNVGQLKPLHTMTNQINATAEYQDLRDFDHDVSSKIPDEVNTSGMEAGIGIGGMEGTKAPFASIKRTIHPKVLESERQRNSQRRP